MKVTELPESGGKAPPPRRTARHHPARRERRATRLVGLRAAARAMARRGTARGALPDRRRRRLRRGRAGGGRPAPRLRQGDLAAPPRPGDARRAIVPGDEHPCQPSLSSRRLAMRAIAALAVHRRRPRRRPGRRRARARPIARRWAGRGSEAAEATRRFEALDAAGAPGDRARPSAPARGRRGACRADRGGGGRYHRGRAAHRADRRAAGRAARPARRAAGADCPADRGVADDDAAAGGAGPRPARLDPRRGPRSLAAQRGLARNSPPHLGLAQRGARQRGPAPALGAGAQPAYRQPRRAR